jgi:hypothetical protein
MDGLRFILVAVGCFGLASPAALAQSDGEIAAQMARPHGAPKPWKNVRGFGGVLDLTKLPLVIDEPGLYAIDRNWELPDSAATVSLAGLIQITAADVTLDLHGFVISSDPGQGTLLVVTGGSAEVRNGGLSACCSDGAVAVHATRGVRLHHLSVFSYDAMDFEGEGASFTDSAIVPRVGMNFANFSNVERNSIVCNFECVTLLGGDNRVTNNRVHPRQGGVFQIEGDRNIVADNIVYAVESIDIDDPFEIAGDSNVVRNNTVLMGGSLHNVISVSGTANTIDGNIGAPPAPAGRAPVGILFTADGNYYGDNRMAAQVPFALGGTVQTDWGGNVGY